MRCRLLLHETLDGPANMARDEALLDSVDAEPSAAVLRTYGWSVPTLSLGYFQRLADAEAEPRWAGVPIVRRPTGGGALWHEHEVTYALIVPRSLAVARRPSDLYRAVHAAIASALRERGIAAERRGRESSENGPDKAFLCFRDRDPEDILLAGSKIVGSAQRRRPRAVLQHGALLLSRAAVTPELPGLKELSGTAGDPGPWIDLLRAEIPRRLGLDANPDEMTDDEKNEAFQLEREVYNCPDWNARR